MEILKSNLSFKTMSKRAPASIREIIMHHTASSNDTVETIHKYHLGLGWSGIGYNYVVYKDGRVFEGRPKEYIPAHTQNHNTNSIGIVLIGNFEGAEPTKEQLASTKALVSQLKKDIPFIENLSYHKHYNVTACPGKNMDKYLNELRDSFNAKYEDLPVLRRGSTGYMVKRCQELLNIGNKEFNNRLTPLVADGIFGDKTFAAVKEFQKNTKILVDGIVGKQTWRELTVYDGVYHYDF